jgi:chromosome segregation ATPase
VGNTPPSSRRQKHSSDLVDDLDKFSLQLVSSLQGSSTLHEAQARARTVLADVLTSVDSELSETRSRAEKISSANKILGRALQIMKNKLGEAQKEASDAKARLSEAEERARQSEHAVQVLRWHLQHDRPSGDLKAPPDVF